LELENLRELFNSPGWEAYREQAEETVYNLFIAMLDLEPNDPQSFITFLQLKTRINQIRDMTYILESNLAVSPDKVEIINETYKGIFRRLTKKLFLGE
jgi:hypothetical protein